MSCKGNFKVLQEYAAYEPTREGEIVCQHAACLLGKLRLADRMDHLMTLHTCPHRCHQSPQHLPARHLYHQV